MAGSGRKKHVVTGNVAEVKKQENGLGMESVGKRKGGLFEKLFGSKEKK